MTIADTIESMAINLSNAYDEIDTKGGTLPQNKNLENLADAIASISGDESAENLAYVMQMDYFSNIAEGKSYHARDYSATAMAEYESIFIDITQGRNDNG